TGGRGAPPLPGKIVLLAGLLAFAASLHAQAPLPGTEPLTQPGDLSAQMIAGIDRFLDAETGRAVARRESFWRPDLSGDRAAYERSVQPNRDRLTQMLGLIDPRVPEVEVEFVASVAVPALVAETDRFTAHAVRWPVLDGLEAEGLLLRPRNGSIVARVVVVPDADQTPELIAGLAPGLSPERHYARRLAENGCEVLIPTLADRSDRFSGNPVLERFTNHPHREWIYRQSFVLGRHVIGYEIQKILAAVDWFERRNREGAVRVGVAGWGEGGLLALHSAAVDRRIDATLVSGYFAPRERLWQEPIYRNLFGVLNEFGDANLARLVVPRALHLEHAAAPVSEGPPRRQPGRAGAAPGRLDPIRFADVQAEVERARRAAGPHAAAVQLHAGAGGTEVGPLADETLRAFLRSLGVGSGAVRPPGTAPVERRPSFDPAARQERVVRGMERYTQRQIAFAADAREAFLWRNVKPTTPAAWHDAMRPYRTAAWDERIGRFPMDNRPLNPRTRLIHDRPAWKGYEVVLDVLPEVFAWGYLLLPKDLKPGERRPVVVTQHGVRGLPADLINEDVSARAYETYKAYAVRLVERGFIVFVPHNPYRGDDPSRVLQRKAQPIGKTIFAIILAQHERLLDFLSGRPEVDPKRIGFYGLSYGGQTAMRVPVLLERYALAICSGDFNEWTWKNATTQTLKAYIFNEAYERPEFRMGLYFGYAELAALMVPRPFMVERGHNDAVAIDETVAYEYAKVNRLYNKLGLADRTEIEYFDGPHTIHGVGTYRFLHRHLAWPEPGERR
ncbi:MAG: dienelactone hydrolase family protein, partial [Opitutaceae bacterium]|nr:dienelactone hydrolase family protein [Opitutaceae bacterium]